MSVYQYCMKGNVSQVKQNINARYNTNETEEDYVSLYKFYDNIICLLPNLFDIDMLYYKFNISDLKTENHDYLSILDKSLFKIKFIQVDSEKIKENVMQRCECVILLNVLELHKYENIDDTIPNYMYIIDRLSKNFVRPEMPPFYYPNFSNMIYQDTLYDTSRALFNPTREDYSNKLFVMRTDIIRLKHMWVDLIEKKRLLTRPVLYKIVCKTYGKIAITNPDLASVLLYQLKSDCALIVLTKVEMDYWHEECGIHTVLYSDFITNISHYMNKQFIVVNVINEINIQREFDKFIRVLRYNRLMSKLIGCMFSRLTFNNNMDNNMNNNMDNNMNDNMGNNMGNNIINNLYDARWDNGLLDFSNILKNIYINRDSIINHLVINVSSQDIFKYFNLISPVKPITFKASSHFNNAYKNYMKTNPYNTETYNQILESAKLNILLPDIGQKMVKDGLLIINDNKYFEQNIKTTFVCHICTFKCNNITNLVLYKCGHYTCYECFIKTMIYSNRGINFSGNPIKCSFCNQTCNSKEVCKLSHKILSPSNHLIKLYEDYGKLYPLSGYIKFIKFIQDCHKISKSNKINFILVENNEVAKILNSILKKKYISNSNVIALGLDEDNKVLLKDRLSILLESTNIQTETETETETEIKNKNKNKNKIGFYIMEISENKKYIRDYKFINIIFIIYRIFLDYNKKFSYNIYQYIAKGTMDELYYG